MIRSSRPSYTEYERTLEEVEELKELSLQCPIIVEGRRDMEALRSMGVEGEMLQVSNGVPFCEFCDAVAKHPDVILMTDMDREGWKLARRLRSSLSQRGVRVNERFRLSLMRRLDAHQVEDLYTRLTRIEEQVFRY